MTETTTKGGRWGRGPVLSALPPCPFLARGRRGGWVGGWEIWCGCGCGLLEGEGKGASGKDGVVVAVAVACLEGCVGIVWLKKGRRGEGGILRTLLGDPTVAQPTNQPTNQSNPSQPTKPINQPTN
jgi:hypothetical protein